VRVGGQLPSNETYAIRLQNTVASGAPIIIPSLADALGMAGMHSCVETTLSIQQTRHANDAARLQWKKEGSNTRKEGGGIVLSFSCSDTAITLVSLDIRTFTFGVGKQHETQ